MKLEAIQVSPIGTNCYLLEDEKTHACAIVDPGGDAPRILAQVEESGCAPSCILLTHGHYDHTGGVAGLVAQYPGLPVYISPKDLYPADDRRAAQLFPPLPAGNLRTYDDGDEVNVGQLSVRVLATPGHSKGSVTLMVEDVLLCGDTLFAGSCGRTDLYGGDWEELLASLRRLGRLPANFHVLPGHMETTDLDCERSTNPFLLQALRD